jgi:hypothetical protein
MDSVLDGGHIAVCSILYAQSPTVDQKVRPSLGRAVCDVVRVRRSAQAEPGQNVGTSKCPSMAGSSFQSGPDFLS